MTVFYLVLVVIKVAVWKCFILPIVIILDVILSLAVSDKN
jgi:hypothetical protein